MIGHCIRNDCLKRVYEALSNDFMGELARGCDRRDLSGRLIG